MISPQNYQLFYLIIRAFRLLKSLLLSNHMVTVEKKDGRVYYQLNQETLREIMKCFREIFL